VPRATYARERALAGPVAGVDEAGRGPLAGPVVAAAVILPARRWPPGIADSKALSAAARERLTHAIRACAQVGVGLASVEEIGALNIHHATLLAMRRAVAALPVAPAHLLVDGRADPRAGRPTTCLVGGDALSLSIAAASIVAKVARDALMAELDAAWPAYGFARHKGYPSPAHLAALRAHGPCAAHRRGFAPVAACLAG
jgi:ribonuclease HII